MSNNSARIKVFEKLTQSLKNQTDTQIQAILKKGKSLNQGIGGHAYAINLEQSSIFVKFVPLTQLERQTAQENSTRNYFNLPMQYQYGVGSAGFGAWRELKSHQMASEWALSGHCQHFPLMYHWRILPSHANAKSSYWQNIDDYCDYWENNSSIRQRVEAIQQATHHIALFLEYVPQNLSDWLADKINQKGKEADAAVHFVETNLKQINQFMMKQNFIHFDAHFENILTDGHQLYLSDFGLSLSETFDLSSDEKSFMQVHQHYDFACAAVNLCHSIATSHFGQQDWAKYLEEMIYAHKSELSSLQKATLKKYAPLAITMDDFFIRMQKSSKLTPYPRKKVALLLKSLRIV